MNSARTALVGLVAAGLLLPLAAAASSAIDSPPSLAEARVLAAPDIAKFEREDGKGVGGAYRYGVVVDVDGVGTRFSGRKAAGKWRGEAGGIAVWAARVISPGAKSLDFEFSRFVLPEGAEVRIASADGSVLRGPFTAADTNADGGFFSPYVHGDDAVIEVRVAAAQRGEVDVELASASHAYRGLFELAEYNVKSGSCNVDVACPAGTGWQDPIDSVGHYTFRKSNSTYVCTGSLIATTAGTTVPYFLTANHCVSTETVANSLVVYWNYQSDTCRTPGSSSSGTPLSKNIATHTQSGATLVATHSASDFALLKLTAAVPSASGPYWSGWDRRNVAPSSAVGIHHPAGHEKRIAVDNNALTISGYGGASGSTHLRVGNWEQGTTEGGSSGSGLWNADKRLVGQLHGGSAACGNSLSDYYGRIAVSWTGGGSATSRLSDWLDPNGSGVTTLNGYRSGSTPPPPPPPSNVLQNGVALTGLAASTGGELRYTMSVPAGASNLSFAMSGGTGDADLYVRYGSAPTTSSYDCRPYKSGNSETCSFATPQAGTWHVMLRAYSSFSGVSLLGSYSAGGGSQPSFFENTADYQIRDNSTVESPISVSRSGNAPSSLTVNVRIIHTYIGDLVVDLIAPNGTVRNLHNRSGGSADNIIRSYTVNASSSPANGTWRLRVRDAASGDIGYIDSWSLQF
jgi:lysyl endopeptidase